SSTGEVYDAANRKAITTTFNYTNCDFETIYVGGVNVTINDYKVEGIVTDTTVTTLAGLYDADSSSVSYYHTTELAEYYINAAYTELSSSNSEVQAKNYYYYVLMMDEEGVDPLSGDKVALDTHFVYYYDNDVLTLSEDSALKTAYCNLGATGYVVSDTAVGDLTDGGVAIINHVLSQNMLACYIAAEEVLDDNYSYMSEGIMERLFLFEVVDQAGNTTYFKSETGAIAIDESYSSSSGVTITGIDGYDVTDSVSASGDAIYTSTFEIDGVTYTLNLYITMDITADSVKDALATIRTSYYSVGIFQNASYDIVYAYTNANGDTTYYTYTADPTDAEYYSAADNFDTPPESLLEDSILVTMQIYHAYLGDCGDMISDVTIGGDKGTITVYYLVEVETLEEAMTTYLDAEEYSGLAYFYNATATEGGYDYLFCEDAYLVVVYEKEGYASKYYTVGWSDGFVVTENSTDYATTDGLRDIVTSYNDEIGEFKTTTLSADYNGGTITIMQTESSITRATTELDDYNSSSTSDEVNDA
ncbi:MAG: hypothetical protein R3Y23_06185, partial [Bacillota bacterium]